MQEGRFGACLMAEPTLVARSVAAMQARVAIPVTVKCRIGIDDQDSEADLERFIVAVRRRRLSHLHRACAQGLAARAVAQGKPRGAAARLRRVYRLKAVAHPGLKIVLNGGIASLAEAEAHLARVDGVALGRAAYQNPYLLAEVDRRLLGATAPAARPAGRFWRRWFPTLSGICAAGAGSTT